jgi:putative ubiquitin-RnfH superfamily antitoxin RatB of RatAB toxin-antitoxin module
MSLRVSVAVATPASQEVIEVELPDGATVGDAIAAAALGERFPGLDPGALEVGVWSRPCDRSTPLRDGDRVELYRPLRADAKAERRARARLRTSSPRSRSGR